MEAIHIDRTVSNKADADVTDVEDHYHGRSAQRRAVPGPSHATEGTQEGVINLVVSDEVPDEDAYEEQEEGDSDEIPDDDVYDDEDEGDYEYIYAEDDDDSAFLDNPYIAVASVESAGPATIENEEAYKPKWRQPSKEAVNMSLRAEKETTGGKRRLAQDLYRIMNQDTEEAGFSLQPSSEDCMDTWTIDLFQFDKDSNLAKDMKVLGLSSIELEMSFPDQYPFEPPFVRVTRPRFQENTGFVLNGALCMELLTKVCVFLVSTCLYFRISTLLFCAQ
jgi:ubiquitin-protein ligase